MTKVENYKDASLDRKHVWKLYHRNKITKLGRLTPTMLARLDKLYHVPAKELIFLPKPEVKRLEQSVPPASQDGHSLTIVLRFWSKLNPDKMLNEITVEEYDEMDRSIRRLRILWNQMKARCYNENAQDFPFYGALGVGVCDEWKENSEQFVLWALQNGYRYYPDKRKGDQLSIDRIDPEKNYEPSNCRWIPHRENCSRTRPCDWDFVIDRAYHFAELFPMAADLCYGRARIDWKKARDIYMDGDT